jgi:hypothetical protein
VNIEAGVRPGENPLRPVRAQQLLSDEHRQDLPGEELRQPRVVDPRDRLEIARCVHPPFGHQEVEVRVEIDPVPKSLDGGDGARDELFPRHGLEILRQGVDRRAAKIAQEPTLVLEEYSQHLGDGEDDLAVGDIQKERLPHPFAPLLDPLGMTGRAEGPGAAGEHHQPLLPTPGTPKTGESAARVAAVEIALDYFPDDRPEISALNRFAPEDCKACTPARTGLHRRRGSRRNDGQAPGREPSAPDVEDDRLPPWREKRLRKRANVTKEPGLPWKDAINPGADGEIKSENVNRG